tara:strand:+ start:17 stop:295 length:279 start_codon:yes stop_codon:yes gene_type:complete
MILNTLTPKNLALFGILDTYDNYNVDKDNLIVTASVQIAYNLGDIENKINSISTKMNNLEDMEDLSDDAKDIMRKDYEEILEALNVMKEKLS